MMGATVEHVTGTQAREQRLHQWRWATGRWNDIGKRSA